MAQGMNVGLLNQLTNPFAAGVTGWTGSTLTGSERAKAAADAAEAAGNPKATDTQKVDDDKVVPDSPATKYTFDPFDQASWWKPSASQGAPALGSLVDAKL